MELTLTNAEIAWLSYFAGHVCATPLPGTRLAAACYLAEDPRPGDFILATLKDFWSKSDDDADLRAVGYTVPLHLYDGSPDATRMITVPRAKRSYKELDVVLLI